MLPAAAPWPDAATPRQLAHPARLLAGWFAELGAVAGPDVAPDHDLVPRLLRLADGRVLPLPVARWASPACDADSTLLERARGPVLDVGCGPGRLTAALHAQGVDVLGLELVEDVPVLARAAGAPVQTGDVFGPVQRSGQWRTALLADGNVGIGGDPVRMLRRVRRLLAPGGQVLVELHVGPAPAAGPVRLETLGTASAWFPWALLGTPDLSDTAAAADLAVEETWSAGGREFAALRRAC